jgi:nucleotide-binding universal stress UspA family protein
MRRILVAVDGSPGAREAVSTGIELAGGLGAPLLFVAARAAPASLLGDPFYQRRLSEVLAKLRPAVDAALAAAESAGVPADAEVAEGDPVQVILEVARSWDADVIIVGSRGLGPFAGAILGSVSRAVVHQADRPVLVVKAGSRFPAARTAVG